MKRLFNALTIFVLTAAVMALTSCGGEHDGYSALEPESVSAPAVSADTEIAAAEYDEADLLTEWSEEDGASVMELNGSGIVSIKEAGTYILRGRLDGSVVIEAADSDEVRIILDGVEIDCGDSAPFYAKSADKVIVTLAVGSVNSLSDGEIYSFADGTDEPSGAVFAKCDLTINGEGTLNVKANYNNGIQSKDDLKITGGVINCTAANDGVKGKDSVSIKDAILTVEAGGDGIRSDNSEDAARGSICIESGTLNITAADDGIQAENTLSVTGGDISVTTGGGSANAVAKSGDMWGGRGFYGGESTAEDDTVSAKGLQAEAVLSISGGSITVDSSDDSLRAGGDIVISGGNLILSAGDKGIHSDANAFIEDGSVTILKSYEGIEGANITINGGEISLTASDDGFNASNGGTASAGGFGGGFETVTDTDVIINGGVIHVNASGDGLDSNGSMYITGGEIYVSGPTDSGNGAIDYAGGFEISGGSIIAVGASGMAEGATGGTQCAALVSVTAQSGGAALTVRDGSGNTVIEFTPDKSYDSVFVSTPDMKVGEMYSLKVGETEIASFEQSQTIYSNLSGGMGGFGGMGGGKGGFGGGKGGFGGDMGGDMGGRRRP